MGTTSTLIAVFGILVFAFTCGYVLGERAEREKNKEEKEWEKRNRTN